MGRLSVTEMHGPSRVVVRDATGADLAALCRVRNVPGIHAQHLDTADGVGLRFLVYEHDGQIQAVAMLRLRAAGSSVDAAPTPRISDLYVAPRHRSRGIGSAFITAMEDIAAAAGHTAMYIGVDPVSNPRALALYRRLGYAPASSEPHRIEALFYDDAGVPTERTYWRLDLFKVLAPDASERTT